MGISKTAYLVPAPQDGTPGKDATLYEIVPSLSEVKFERNDENALRPLEQELTVLIKETIGNAVSFYSDPDELGFYLVAEPVPKDSAQIEMEDDGVTVKVYAQDADCGQTNIVLYLKEDDTLIAQKSIPILKDGKKGDAGTDAINIVIDSSEIVFNDTVKAVQVKVNLYEGDTKVAYSSDDGFQCSVFENGYLFDNAVRCTYRGAYPDAYTMSYVFYLEGTAANGAADITITNKGVEYVRKLSFLTIKDGDKGDRGPVLRGPQYWEDCADNFAFQSGGDDDQWLDVVMDENNEYWICVTNHIKSDADKPTATSKKWRHGDKFNLIATKVLLAEYALVKNLGVEAIEMKDAAGNILFYVRDGVVKCNIGVFNNVTVNGYLASPFYEMPTNASGNAIMIRDADDTETDWTYRTEMNYKTSYANGATLYLPSDLTYDGAHIVLMSRMFDKSYLNNNTDDRRFHVYQRGNGTIYGKDFLSNNLRPSSLVFLGGIVELVAFTEVDSEDGKTQYLSWQIVSDQCMAIGYKTSDGVAWVRQPSVT